MQATATAARTIGIHISDRRSFLIPSIKICTHQVCFEKVLKCQPQNLKSFCISVKLGFDKPLWLTMMLIAMLQGSILCFTTGWWYFLTTSGAMSHLSHLYNYLISSDWQSIVSVYDAQKSIGHEQERSLLKWTFLSVWSDGVRLVHAAHWQSTGKISRVFKATVYGYDWISITLPVLVSRKFSIGWTFQLNHTRIVP